MDEHDCGQCGVCDDCVTASVNYANEMECNFDMGFDLDLAIVRYATNVKRKVSPAEFVMGNDN